MLVSYESSSILSLFNSCRNCVVACNRAFTRGTITGKFSGNASKSTQQHYSRRELSIMRKYSSFVFCLKLVGSVWIVVGFAMILLSTSRVIAGWGSGSWPHVGGTIVASNLVPVTDASGKPTFYRINIVYAYSPPARHGAVDTFQNNKLSSRGFVDPAQDSYYSLKEAETLVLRYPVGKQVQVYYNLNKPEISVLRPGENFGTYGGSLIGLLAVIFGALLLFFVRTFTTKCPT